MMVTKSYLRLSVILRLISKTTSSNDLKISQYIRDALKSCSIHLQIVLSRIADFDFSVPYVQHVCTMTYPYVIAHTRCCECAPRVRYDLHSHKAHVGNAAVGMMWLRTACALYSGHVITIIKTLPSGPLCFVWLWLDAGTQLHYIVEVICQTFIHFAKQFNMKYSSHGA